MPVEKLEKHEKISPDQRNPSAKDTAKDVKVTSKSANRSGRKKANRDDALINTGVMLVIAVCMLVLGWEVLVKVA